MTKSKSLFCVLIFAIIFLMSGKDVCATSYLVARSEISADEVTSKVGGISGTYISYDLYDYYNTYVDGSLFYFDFNTEQATILEQKSGQGKNDTFTVNPYGTFIGVTVRMNSADYRPNEYLCTFSNHYFQYRLRYFYGGGTSYEDPYGLDNLPELRSYGNTYFELYDGLKRPEDPEPTEDRSYWGYSYICGQLPPRSCPPSVVECPVPTQVAKIQYQEGGGGNYIDANGTLYVLKDTTVNFKAIPNPGNGTFPSGQPVWSGTSGATGTTDTISVAFNTTSSNPTDYKTVVASAGGNAATVNVVVYELIGTLTPQDNFAGRSQDRYGLLEKIDLSSASFPILNDSQIGNVVWKITSGNGTINLGANGNATYVAPDAPSVDTVVAEITTGASRGQRTSFTKTVVAPDNAVARQYVKPDGTVSNVAHRYGFCSVGFLLELNIKPADVSFSQINFQEGTVPAVTTGYYNFDSGRLHPLSGPFAIMGCNSSMGCRPDFIDQPAFPDGPTPCSNGSFTWDIPWQYLTSLNGSAITFYTARHFQQNSFSNRVTISKAGVGGFTKQIKDRDSDYGVY